MMEESTSQFDDSLGADENELFGDVDEAEAEAECEVVQLVIDMVVSSTHDTTTDNNTHNHIHSHDTADNNMRDHIHSHEEATDNTHDHIHTHEEATTSSTCFTKPFVGMEFETLHKAFLFYNEYAAIVGFSVRKDKTRKSNIDGSYLFRRFCCSKEGYPRKSLENGGNVINGNNGIGMQVKDDMLVKMEAARIQPVPRVGRRAKLDMKRRAEIQQRMRVGCNARLDVKRTPDGRWIVQKYVEEHNHECVSLDETHLLRSHRSRRAARALLDRNGVEELPLSEERIINEVPKPSVGMEFESPHKAYLFYNAYARTLGFVVRKDKTRRSNIDGSLLFRRLCCSKEGYRRKNCENDDNDRKQMIGGVVVKVRTRILPVTRVGCNAKLEVKKSTDGKWVVQKFIEEHNHELDRSGDMHLFRTHKLGETDQEELPDSVTDGSARPKKVSSYIMSEAGGSEKISFVEARLRNRLKKKKRKKLEKGDMQIILGYFRRMQAENPAFFYAIQVDEEDQMSSCFWADARSRSEFGHFGDVVYFETTYGANTYGRPFAPLLGVNNHLQTVLFGCAIILNETEESFVWLLETMLMAMYGRHPVTVITDQDTEMEKAIVQVLPGTNHCLSLWYVLQNTAKNLRHLYIKDDIFSTDFKNCIYEPQLCEEFESSWESLLDKFDLRDNEWLVYLYIRRHKWVPVYSKHIFHAHTMSIQRNKSMHSFFNGYVLSKALPMTEFINQYEKAIVDSREKETYEDSVSQQTNPVLKSELPLEKQAAESYTRLVFQEFHKEFTDSFDYMAVETETLGTIKTFVVSRWGQNSNWLVKVDSCDNDMKVTCSCQNFESVGILCRHILKVFTATNVMLVPDVYVRKRWTKSAKCGIPHKNQSVTECECESSVAFRYRDLFQLALTLSAKGALSLKAYQTASSAVEMKLREVEKVSEGDIVVSRLDVQGINASHSPVEAANNNENSNRLVCEDNPTASSGRQIASSDPPCVRPRGCPPKKVMPSLLENPRKKKARTEPEACEHNGVPSHPRSDLITMSPSRYQKGMDMVDHLSSHDIHLSDFTVTPLVEDSTIDLTPPMVQAHEWSDRRVIVTLGQLKAGLTFPLFNPNEPMLCEILRRFDPRCGVMQLTDNTIRTLKEFCIRSKGETSYPEHTRQPINREEYTVDSFFRTYKLQWGSRGNSRWGLRCFFKTGIAASSKLLSDVDNNTLANDNYGVRHSNEKTWLKFPLIIEGSWVGEGCAAEFTPWIPNFNEENLRTDDDEPKKPRRKNRSESETSDQVEEPQPKRTQSTTGRSTVAASSFGYQLPLPSSRTRQSYKGAEAGDRSATDEGRKKALQTIADKKKAEKEKGKEKGKDIQTSNKIGTSDTSKGQEKETDELDKMSQPTQQLQQQSQQENQQQPIQQPSSDKQEPEGGEGSGYSDEMFAEGPFITNPRSAPTDKGEVLSRVTRADVVAAFSRGIAQRAKKSMATEPSTSASASASASCEDHGSKLLESIFMRLKQDYPESDFQAVFDALTALSSRDFITLPNKQAIVKPLRPSLNISLAYLELNRQLGMVEYVEHLENESSSTKEELASTLKELEKEKTTINTLTTEIASLKTSENLGQEQLAELHKAKDEAAVHFQTQIDDLQKNKEQAAVGFQAQIDELKRSYAEEMKKQQEKVVEARLAVQTEMDKLLADSKVVLESQRRILESEKSVLAKELAFTKEELKNTRDSTQAAITEAGRLVLLQYAADNNLPTPVWSSADEGNAESQSDSDENNSDENAYSDVEIIGTGKLNPAPEVTISAVTDPTSGGEVFIDVVPLQPMTPETKVATTEEIDVDEGIPTIEATETVEPSLVDP